MDWFFWYMLGFWAVALPAIGLGMVFSFRRTVVLEYRRELTRQIDWAVEADRQDFKDWGLEWSWGQFQWRYILLENVSEKYMTLRFWRKCDSFYPDKSFTKSFQFLSNVKCQPTKEDA